MVHSTRTLALRLLAVLAVAGLAVAGAWFGAGASATPATAPRPSPVPVTAASVTRQDVPLTIQGLGTVQAENTVTIRSRVDGELQHILFTEGQEVRAGDPLAQIDPRPFQAVLDQAVARKAQDEAQLANAQRDLARYEALAQRDFSSRQQADTQKALMAQLQAQVAGDQAAIDSARVQLDYATIRSPIDGRVGFRLVDQGNIVHASDPNGIVVVTQERPVSIVFTLPEADLAEVRAAMARGPLTVSVTGGNGGSHPADGVLKLIDNEVDPATGTMRLKAEFPNADDALWPGMFATVRLLVRTDRAALTVPSSAVERGPDGLHVYVIRPDATVELRPVQAARFGSKVAEIDAGLQEGERIVVSGQLKVQPGARVIVTGWEGAVP
jgi:membrane fusion protein, multidrug efflux system